MEEGWHLFMIYTIIIGLLIGSFLNVCIYRIPRKESIVFGASHCTSCSQKIKWYDLIPVISYIILRGRCRSCRTKISAIYPIIELANMLAYIGFYWCFGISVLSVILAVLFSALLVLIIIKVNA